LSGRTPTRALGTRFTVWNYDAETNSVRLLHEGEHPGVQKSVTLRTGVWHAWRTEVRGRRLRLFLDATEIFTHDLETLEDAGRISLVGQGPAPVEFDDVQVLRLSP
jgi:hypothetical protein